MTILSTRTVRQIVSTTDYLTRAQARASIFEYIEAWYNRVRRHSKLGYLSSVDFEASLPQ